MKATQTLRMHISLVLILLVSSFSACLALAFVVDWRTARLTNVEDLKKHVNSPSGYYSTLFEGVFYSGTDDNFDYIVLSRHLDFDVFKIRAGELDFVPRMKLRQNQKNWINVTDRFPSQMRTAAEARKQ